MQLKTCGTCKRELDLSFFSVRTDGKIPRARGECRDCRSQRQSRNYRSNTEHHAEVMKKRYDSFGRFARYGLTKEEYEARFEQQGRCCGLCGSKHPGTSKTWHIDHEHSGMESRSKKKQADKQQFRGILCHRCNLYLGHYEALMKNIGLSRLNAYLGRKT